MFTIKVKTNDKELSGTFYEQVLLSVALEQLGLPQDKPCGGKGSCKKCRVTANGKEVLSCQTYVNSDTLIEYVIKEHTMQGMTDGFMPAFEKKPLITDGYGMAVDIGTTTVAGYLYQFPQCRQIKCVAVPNPQAVYGADVISRIEHAGKGGLCQLQEEICNCIRNLAEDYPIEKYVITGNTTMLHLLTGNDPSGIAISPYTPQTLFGGWYKNAYLPPCISAYVGADITTAILASGMLKDKTSLLVDIGTNGEMVLWHNGTLTCCSTAAGPALEGAGITHGTCAVGGAINKVFIKDGAVEYTTIENLPAVGLCGSGLIDTIACLLQLGVIDETGYMEQTFPIGDSGICLTPEDVRQVQLAKSAIRSGIDTLLNCNSLCYDDIDTFYLAGGFGSYLDIRNGAILKLIPDAFLPKTMVIGNAAGTGSIMLLHNKDFLKEAEYIASIAKTEELSSNHFFMKKYIENMLF